MPEQSNDSPASGPSTIESAPRMWLAGKVAVVTGGASGIGAAIADRLAAEGGSVVVVDIDGAGAQRQAEAIAAAGGHALSATADVAIPESVRRMASDVLGRAGRVDVLVNNAGITGVASPLVDYPDEEWTRVIGIDLLGVYHCTKAFLPGMLERRWGRVINIASVSGKEGNPWMTAYAAAKAGVLGLTKALGKELATTGVLVNAVTPSGVSETGIQRTFHMDPEVVALIPRTPMGRLARPQEVAALVAWLASEECTFSTGAVFDISGGRAMY